mmetsp:Transcript_20028/g.36318  ORF Transcript_20028/g.36318 Transcript_20028/m.36318 type:complete len:81 (-) Transcript_20028:24-266(-)
MMPVLKRAMAMTCWSRFCMAGVNPYSADMKDTDEVRSWCQELTSNNLCLDSPPLAMLHMLLWETWGLLCTFASMWCHFFV